MICLLLFNLLSYTSAMDPDCMHCMHYIDQCSPSCPEPTTMDCGREMMNCPGPVDFQGCAMPGTCVAVGEECPFYCPYVPPMDCGEGERTCPGPIDSKGCKTIDQCVPYGEDCPLQSPGSKDNGVVISGGGTHDLNTESLSVQSRMSSSWFPSKRLKPQANCSIPQVPTPRNRHTLSVINNGTTLVACGQVNGSTRCVSWQAGKGGWKDYATLSGKRLRGYGHAAVVLPNDTIIVVGSNEREQTGEIVGSGKEFPLQNSGYLTCAIHSDQNEFVTIGGADLTNGGATHGKVDRYDSQGNYLGSLPDLIEPRGDHACASFTSSNGEKGFLVAGGVVWGYLSSTEIFLPSENKWRKGGDLPWGLRGPRAFHLNGQVFVTGGYHVISRVGTQRAEVLAYDASTDTWVEIGKMEKARAWHAVVGVNLRALCPVQD